MRLIFYEKMKLGKKLMKYTSSKNKMEGISIIDTFVIEKTIKNIIEKLLINQQIYYLKYVKI